MWLGLAILFFVIWTISRLVFHTTAPSLHLLVIGAVVCGAIHIIQSVRTGRIGKV